MKTYLFTDGKSLMIRACTEDQLESAQYFFSVECGHPVALIASGSADLAEDCFCEHYRNWYWHGMYSFSSDFLWKFAPTHHEYVIALAKMKAVSTRVKLGKFVSKVTSKIRTAVNEVVWILGLEDESGYDYDECDFNEEV
ncbi:MAG: hypothetical protein F6J98_03085 [Moorea sp. SIO4G2]|nr:hypothetical protein [Moorena sp. SIO4G2]